MKLEPPIRLRETIVDPRDLMREYVVLVAIAAITVVVAIDAPSVFSIGVAVVAVLFVAIALLAALPGSVALTIDDGGFAVGTFFVLTRRIPWSAVGAIEVAEGWQGETVAIEVGGDIGGRTIFGLPIDPTLGRRAFVTTFGLTAEDLCDRLVGRRDGEGAKGPGGRRAGAAARRST